MHHCAGLAMLSLQYAALGGSMLPSVPLHAGALLMKCTNCGGAGDTVQYSVLHPAHKEAWLLGEMRADHSESHLEALEAGPRQAARCPERSPAAPSWLFSVVVGAWLRSKERTHREDGAQESGTARQQQPADVA